MADSADELLAKMMEGLQKFTGPVFEQANKIGWGGTKVETTTVHDPLKTQQALADIPDVGDRLLGAVNGFLTGMYAGEELSTGAAPGGFFDKASPLVGAALGSFMGSESFSTSRSAGNESIKTMNNIAGAAKTFGDHMRTNIASDAVNTYTQRMGELNNPTNVMSTMEKSVAKDKAITDLTAEFFRAGIAPDKATEAAQNIGKIYDPGGRFTDTQSQLTYTMMEFNAIPNPTEQDKKEYRAKMDAILVGELAAKGKIAPSAARGLYNKTAPGGGGGAPGPAVPPSSGALSPRAPGRAAPSPAGLPSSGGGSGDLYGPPLPPMDSRNAAIDQLMGGPGTRPAPKANSLKPSAPSAKIDPNLLAPVNIPQGLEKGLTAKLEGINNARGLSSELVSLLESGAVKSGPTNGRSFEVYLEGVSGKFGASIAGAGGGFELPPLGAGEVVNGSLTEGNWLANLMGGNKWEGGAPEEVVAGLSDAYNIAKDIARAGVAAKQGRSINQISQSEIQAELLQIWNPKFDNEQNLRNLDRYLKNLDVNLSRTNVVAEPQRSAATRGPGFFPYPGAR